MSLLIKTLNFIFWFLSLAFACGALSVWTGSGFAGAFFFFGVMVWILAPHRDGGKQ